MSSDGAAHVTLMPREPCTCACTSVFYDGVIYGPGTWHEVHQTVMKLHKEADFHMGLTAGVVEANPDVVRSALAHLAEHHHAPGERLGDPE